MIDIIDNKKCNGCLACFNVCPTKAISIKNDCEGFAFPNVDKEKCIKCQKCLNVCTANNNPLNNNNIEPTAYAINSINAEIRNESSSGGFFSIIALYVLSQKGVVFGAAFDSNFSLKHIYIQSEKDLWKLRGSKYLQSDIDISYIEVKKMLDVGRLVLFSGTPCQVGGLKRFLGREYENLITIDIICHGVPSPMVWKKYLEYMENKNKSKICRVSFRNKSYGWKKFSMHLEFENNKVYNKTHNQDAYFQSFLNNLSLRKSCYNCNYKTKNRDSDFTLADFWGIENFDVPINYENGTSLVILHSAKAKKMLELLKSQMESIEVDFLKAIQFNSAMLHSVDLNKNREAFLKCVYDKNFNKASKKFLKEPFKLKIKRAIKKLLRRR